MTLESIPPAESYRDTTTVARPTCAGEDGSSVTEGCIQRAGRRIRGSREVKRMKHELHCTAGEYTVYIYTEPGEVASGRAEPAPMRLAHVGPSHMRTTVGIYSPCSAQKQADRLEVLIDTYAGRVNA